MRGFLRVSAVVLLALGALLFNASDIVDPWYPWSTFGVTTNSSGIITSVDDYALSHGVHEGDAVNFSAMPLRDRVQLGGTPSSYNGRTMLLQLHSRKPVEFVSHTRQRSVADNVTDILAVTSLLLYTLIAAALVLLRPTPATWAFFVFSAGLLYNGNQALQYFPVWLAVSLLFIMVPLLQAAGPVAFFSFTLRFPNALPQGRAASLERIIWYVVGPVLVLLNVASQSIILVGVPFPTQVTTATQYAIAAMYLPGILQFYSRYSRADRAERARLQWAVAAFAIAFLPYLFLTAAENANANVISLPMANLTQAWLVVAPLALAYTILKHRLFDIRFVVSRALIFGFLTTVTIGTLAVTDWALGKWLERSRLHILAEVAIALLLGFSLTTLHKRIESILNRVIFAAQTAALAAIRRFSHEVDLIADPHQLLTQTLETLRRRIDAEYVALYTEDGATFVQSAPTVEFAPPLFSANDLAVLRLRRWTEPFECDVPDHPLRAALLLPMTTRAQLVGFIVCGPKMDRTHYIPEEVETLQSLAHRAGAGYAWLTMRRVTALAPSPSA